MKDDRTAHLRLDALFASTYSLKQSRAPRTLLSSTKVDTSAVSADRLRHASSVSGRPPAYRLGRATRDERRLHLRIRLSMLRGSFLREGISIKDPLFGISKLKASRYAIGTDPCGYCLARPDLEGRAAGARAARPVQDRNPEGAGRAGPRVSGRRRARRAPALPTAGSPVRWPSPGRWSSSPA